LEDRRVLASFLVLTSGDSGNGVCSAGSCTLRDAVLAANAQSEADTITFAPAITGTISLAAAKGALLITNPVTISGPGASQLTLRALASPTNEFRVIDIAESAGNVTIEGLTLSGGRVSTDGGGAIRLQGSGMLTVRDSVIAGNFASNGGGIFSALDGTLSISGSTISGNTAMLGSGGGINNAYGNTVLNSSTLSNNTSTYSGGGLFSPEDGTITITDSQITGNRVTEDGNHGGGVYSGNGSLTISRSTISGNTSEGDGGGLYSIGGTFAITSSTITNNQAGYSGGGIFNDGGTLSLTASRVSDNTALYGDGGGISNNTAALTLTRSTISGNRSVTDGGGISNNSGLIHAIESLMNANTSGGDGGAIATITGGVTLTNSTLSGNAANVRGGAVQSDSAPVRAVNSTLTLNTANIAGGGINVTAANTGESIMIQNSIIAGNTSPSGPDFVAPAVPATNLQVRSSLIGHNGATTLAAGSPAANGNFIGSAGGVLNAMLQPLASRGGPTMMHGLMPASLAVDAGDNALAVNFGVDGAPGGGDDAPLLSDQRGGLYLRAADSGSGEITDMGAFELQPAITVLTVDTTADVVNGNFAEGDRSLREMVELANTSPGLDTILFEPGLGPSLMLHPALGSIVISDTLTIEGPGADQLRIEKDPGASFRLFSITATANNVSFRGLTLAGGNAGSQDGGAIGSQSSGQVSIIHSTLQGNMASSGGAVAATAGTVAIAASTLSGNRATANGGAIAVRGQATALNLVDATISTNSASLSGGGIYSENTPVTVFSSTLTLNSAVTVGGGIGLLADGNGESLTIRNSIIAGNSAGDSADFLAPMDAASDLDVDFSLIGDLDGTTLSASTLVGGRPQPDARGNLVGGGDSPVIDPLLAPLGPSGGSTATHRPLESSLAIDAGNPGLLPLDTFDIDRDNNTFETLPVDQRGAARLVGTLDIGAVELAPLPPVSWPQPGAITFGTPLGGGQFNATSTVAGTFQYTPPAGTVLSAGEDQLLSAVFTPSNPLAFRTLNTSVTIDVLQAEPLLNWEDPDPITFGTPLSVSQLNATADVAGTFVYDPMLGTVLGTGNQTLSVTFTPADATNFKSVERSVTLLVIGADPELVWGEPDDIVFGTALGASQLNATAAVAGTFVYSPPLGTVLNAGPGQLLSVTFTPDDADFTEATAMVTIDVAKAFPMISWADPDSIPLGTPLDGSQLNATADVAGTFVYDPPSGTILGAGDDQMLSVTFTPTDSVNFESITAEVFIDVTQGLDFGDAPGTYPVLLSADGARHALGSLLLGAAIDDEADGQPSPNADGDGSDEDGVAVIASAVAAGGASSTASFLVESSQSGRLDAWIDFNRDGDWLDTGEQIATSRLVVAGVNILSYTVPAGSLDGGAVARFRLSTAGGLQPTGAAADGEVEDMIVTLLDGDAAADASVLLPGSSAVITAASGRVTVSAAADELFAAPQDSLTSLAVRGASDDDRITLDFSQAPSGVLNLDGQGGDNTLVITPASVDLTGPGRITAQNFGTIDTTATASNLVKIDAAAVASLSPIGKTITIIGGALDVIVFADANAWRLAAPKVDAGQFIRVVVNQIGAETVEVHGPSVWQNPLEASDVNSNGEVTAGDALVIINELGRRLFSDANSQLLQDPVALVVFPGTYYDQNADGKCTALDALRVINRLAQLSNRVQSEMVVVPPPLAMAVAAEDTVADADAAPQARLGTLNAKPVAAIATSQQSAIIGQIERDTASHSEVSWSERIDQLLSDRAWLE
jgi:hypothetical protein